MSTLGIVFCLILPKIIQNSLKKKSLFRMNDIFIYKESNNLYLKQTAFYACFYVIYYTTPTYKILYE